MININFQTNKENTPLFEKDTILYKTGQEKLIKYRIFFEKACDAKFIIKDYQCIECNLKALEMFKCSQDEIIGNTFFDFSPEIQPDGSKSETKAKEIVNLALEGKPQVFEWLHLRSDGTLFYSEIALNRIELSGECFLLATLRDITHRKKTEKEILKEKIKAEQYLNLAGTMIVVLDIYGNVSFINRKGCEVLGYNQKELIDRNWIEMVIPLKEKKKTRKIFSKILNGQMGCFRKIENSKVVRKNGELRIISWTNNLLKDEQGNIIGILRSGIDITRRKELEQQLIKLATIDPLTGAYNRYSFLEKAQVKLNNSLRHKKDFTFLMLDIDNFKQINDNYGHHIGDEVLKAMVRECKALLRKTDIFGRIGGEEFGIALIETDAKKGLRVAERLRKNLAKLKIKTEKNPIYFTVSIGLATLLEGENSIEQIMKRADKALYEAKNNGRNCVRQG